MIAVPQVSTKPMRDALKWVRKSIAFVFHVALQHHYRMVWLIEIENSICFSYCFATLLQDGLINRKFLHFCLGGLGQKRMECVYNVLDFQGAAWGTGFCLYWLGVLKEMVIYFRCQAGDCWEQGEYSGLRHHQRSCSTTNRHQEEQGTTGLWEQGQASLV